MSGYQEKRLNRSFSRRIGKTLSALQKDLLESRLPTFLINKESLDNIRKQDKEIYLEVGFGMGEHFVHQTKNKPDDDDDDLDDIDINDLFR
jgi:release factor glutamine methyltransferase